jgi:hypothetical protein
VPRVGGALEIEVTSKPYSHTRRVESCKRNVGVEDVGDDVHVRERESVVMNVPQDQRGVSTVKRGALDSPGNNIVVGRSISVGCCPFGDERHCAPGGAVGMRVVERMEMFPGVVKLMSHLSEAAMDLLQKDVCGAIKVLIEKAVLLRSYLGVTMEKCPGVPRC